MPKNAQTTTQLYSSHKLAKWMLKILQVRLQCEPLKFQLLKLDLEKAGGPEIKLPISAESLKKQESSRKNIYFYFIDNAKAFDCVDLKEN